MPRFFIAFSHHALFGLFRPDPNDLAVKQLHGPAY
ncbi:protein of unknown function [Candidatus Methylomirabilis oxygeniifera]|uniref:Uncharacterized protein n=1 Tax=Methylomirabilis oxygeniifera TaxID=671143 RepID=D5MLV7_METO1|nr:protein of unknown function [Candidatus Methylomirabilis oxyfera]